MAASEEWIKHRAYELWEQEGYPSGKDQEHWERAKLEYAALKPVASEDGLPKRKAAAPKAEKAAAKSSTTKTASPKKSGKTEPAAEKPAVKTTAKPKAVKAAAASTTPDQTKKRPKKAAAE